MALANDANGLPRMDANPANSYKYPCWRYAWAQELLGKLGNQAESSRLRMLASWMLSTTR
jgi:hypothetical protein